MEEKKEQTEEKNTQISMEAQEIGVLEKEKQKGSLGVIIFFFILIGVTIGLPYIKDYLETKKTTSIQENEEKVEEKENIKTPKEAEELVYYEIDNNTEFTFANSLKFTNLSKESSDDYYLLVTITNLSNKTINLNQNYYFELYNVDQTLIERVKIVSDKALDNNQNINLKLLISESSYNNAVNLTISQKTEEDYQEVTLNNQENDYDVLACVNKERNLKYYFKDNKLDKISDIIEYENNNAQNYNDILKKYTTEASNLNNIKGISSNLVDTTTSFTMNTQIDLKEADISTLNNKNYYSLNTNPKVVKFELEAQRYICK